MSVKDMELVKDGVPRNNEQLIILALVRGIITDAEGDYLADEIGHLREENERLKKVNYILVDAVKVALQVWGSAMYPQTTAILESAIKEYGGKE